MNPRVILFSFLALFWLALAVVMAFRLYEPWLNNVEDWKRFAILGLAVTMMLFNGIRIYWLMQRSKRKDVAHAPTL